jgi:hypothetical protein
MQGTHTTQDDAETESHTTERGEVDVDTGYTWGEP